MEIIERNMEVFEGGRPYQRITLLSDPNLQVICPMCNAERGIRCHDQPGIARFDSHIQRKERAEERRADRLELETALALLDAQAHDVMRRTP